MKYQHAYNATQQLVSIDDLGQADRKQTFNCLVCLEPMIPKMGEIRIHHFSHKPNLTCNRETYLHKLGKQVFYDTYSQCLANQQPFLIELPQFLCRQPYLHLPGITPDYTCAQKFTSTFDLTQYYPQIVQENREGHFIPDLILRDAKGRAGIFIEIKVTNGCSPEKLASGQRIIELTLKQESDIDIIRSAHLLDIPEVTITGSQATYPKNAVGLIRFFNFDRVYRKLDADCNCADSFVFVFAIHNVTGKIYHASMTMTDADQFSHEYQNEICFLWCEKGDAYGPTGQHFLNMLNLAESKGIQSMFAAARKSPRHRLFSAGTIDRWRSESASEA